MTIRPRGRSFMVDVKVNGDLNPTRQDVRIRTTVKDRDTAIRAEAIIRSQVMRSGAWDGSLGDDKSSKPSTTKKASGGTLQAAVDLAFTHPLKGWKLTKEGLGQKRNAQAVADFLGTDTLCSEIETDHFNRAAQHFADSGNSSDTVTRKLQAFYRALWFAEEMKWIRARPRWSRPTPGQPRQYTFTPEVEAEVIAYFEAVELCPQMADLFRLGIDTGARLSELLELRREDVNLRDTFLLVRGKGGHGSKNGEVRTVVLSTRAAEVLGRLVMKTERGGRLFPGWTIFKVSRRMQMARAAMGEEGNSEFCFHATRHTCGTRMAEAGVELLHMMDQLGHKTASMTQRYVKMSPAARRAAMQRAMGWKPQEPAKAAQGD